MRLQRGSSGEPVEAFRVCRSRPQCKLFDSIKPLFANKPTFIVINKIDVTRPEDLDEKNKAYLDSLIEGSEGTVKLLQLSCVSEEGVMDVRNQACEALLAQRVDMKEKTKRADSVLNRLRVATPFARDEVARTPFIPEGVALRKKYDKEDPERRMLERDIELENGGAGVFSADIKSGFCGMRSCDADACIVPQRTTCSRTPSGNTTSCPSCGRGRISPIS
jgi:nucleolar GTP-binding protein